MMMMQKQCLALLLPALLSLIFLLRMDQTVLETLSPASTTSAARATAIDKRTNNPTEAREFAPSFRKNKEKENEEVVRKNEELVKTNEELVKTNEELVKANEELVKKIEEEKKRDKVETIPKDESNTELKNTSSEAKPSVQEKEKDKNKNNEKVVKKKEEEKKQVKTEPINEDESNAELNNTVSSAKPVVHIHPAMRGQHDNNQAYWRKPKPTPTGWWPDDKWLETCGLEHSKKAVPFVTAPEFAMYRLGDCIKMCWCCDCVTSPHDSSLIASYVMAGGCKVKKWGARGQNRQKYGNVTLLSEVLNTRDNITGFEKPDPDALVVHLRLGDMIEDSKANLTTILTHGAVPGNVAKIFSQDKSVKSVYEFLTNAVESDAKSVILRGGAHKPEFYQKSKPFAYCIRDTLEKAGYPTDMRIDGGNPDHDFYFMSNAKKIVLAAGGFSRFIGRNVIRRGGQIVGRMWLEKMHFDPDHWDETNSM